MTKTRSILPPLAAACLGAALMAALAAWLYARAQFALLGAVCGRAVAEQPELEPAILAAVKWAAQGHGADAAGQALLRAYGYTPSQFASGAQAALLGLALAAFLAAALLVAGVLRQEQQRFCGEAQALAAWLARVNAGETGVLVQRREDALSCLQDEVYKTVTALYQTRNAAVEARERFAANLANIAHQLKTPITAISLSAQLLEQGESAAYGRQIRRQLDRLLQLEEGLLLLSRIDAGTLALEQKPTDLYTAVMLAADQLEALFEQAEVRADIPELGPLPFSGDLGWTVEAVANLLKNCLEHSPPGGAVHVAGESNPLYTGLRIWDEGPGFAREDLPHLFERFYCGRGAKSGTGLGLAFAQELAELQNGTLTARSLPGGGACFELRLYRR